MSDQYDQTVSKIAQVEDANHTRLVALERLSELAREEPNKLVRDLLDNTARKLRSEIAIDEKWLTDLYRQRDRHAPDPD